MVTAVKSSVSNETKEAVKKDLLDYECKRLRGENVPTISKKLSDIAELYEEENVSIHIVRNCYYREVKDIAKQLEEKQESTKDTIPKEENPEPEEKKEEKPDIDASIQEFSKQPQTTIKPPPAKYLPGQRVTVRVLAIRPYGVIVETTDGSETQGLIHISEVKDHFISDLKDYFEEDDIIKNVAIKRIEKDKKLSLSTLDTRLPLKQKKEEESELFKNTSFTNQPMSEKLETYRKQYADSFSSFDFKAGYASEIEEADKKEEQAAEEEAAPDPEIEEMTEYIKGIVGKFSPEAEEKLKELKSTHQSVFKLTRSIMESEKDFEPDVSLLFMNEVAKRLNEGFEGKKKEEE